MKTQLKAFVGPRLRQLRREHGHTQAEMAEKLGVSPAYINLMEHNQRSLSVRVLVGLLEHYGVDWQNLVGDLDNSAFNELRQAMQDPLFSDSAIDQRELKAALEHAPTLVDHFLHLHEQYRAALDNMMRLGHERAPHDLIASSPETVVHDFFRSHSNDFEALETKALKLSESLHHSGDDPLVWLSHRLKTKHNIRVITGKIDVMQDTLRIYDAERGEILLSEAFDYINKVFQLAHMIGLLEFESVFERISASLKDRREIVLNRCKVELANYFAAAILMPYDDVLTMAEQTGYDIDRLAARFNVSFEQVCHRLTTLQKEGRKGIPFFFLRVDKAGNVTKRFNSTRFKIAEFGGSCPVWNMHTAFRTPGVVVPQLVELPEGDRFLTLSRTTERPVFSKDTQDRRLVLSLGCSAEYAKNIVYAEPLTLNDQDQFAQIGINCHLCPREACSQRAHQPLMMELKLDPARRGSTRY